METRRLAAPLRVRATFLVIACLSLGFAKIGGRGGVAPNHDIMWHGLPVPYFIHSAGYSGMPMERVTAAIDRAFGHWQDVDCAEVTFEPSVAGQDVAAFVIDGQNSVWFEEREVPREIDPAHTLAATGLLGATCTGAIAEVDMVVNAVNFRWSDDEPGGTIDLETVMIHEAGHFLGLDHSDVGGAIMLPNYVGHAQRGLGADDQAGVCSIYPNGRHGPCARSADCEEGDTCQGTLVGPRLPGLRCGAPLGEAQPGGRCGVGENACDTGCSTGFCLDGGFCSAACVTDEDCPADKSCFLTRTPEWDVSICLAVKLCDDDVDACPEGQACAASGHPYEAQALRYCRPIRTAQPVGAACNSFDDCGGLLCLEGRCSRLCDENRDCGPLSYCVNERLIVGPEREEVVSLCRLAPACAVDADCAEGGELCAFVDIGGVVDRRCVPPGGAPDGEACEIGLVCEGGVCLGGICSGPCRVDADCVDGMACDVAPVFGGRYAVCIPFDVPPPPSDGALDLLLTDALVSDASSASDTPALADSGGADGQEMPDVPGLDDRRALADRGADVAGPSIAVDALGGGASTVKPAPGGCRVAATPSSSVTLSSFFALMITLGLWARRSRLSRAVV